MGEGDWRQFLEDVRNDPDNSIDRMLGTIQAEKSQCFGEDDRKRIFSVIRETVGFSKIDSMVFEQYRDWVISVAMDALENCIDDLERLHLLRVVGMLYLGQGKYREAAPFLNECFEKRTSILGENHLDTLSSMNDVAGPSIIGKANMTRRSPCSSIVWNRGSPHWVRTIPTRSSR
jgi:hypothetical protein